MQRLSSSLAQEVSVSLPVLVVAREDRRRAAADRVHRRAVAADGDHAHVVQARDARARSAAPVETFLPVPPSSPSSSGSFGSWLGQEIHAAVARQSPRGRVSVEHVHAPARPSGVACVHVLTVRADRQLVGCAHQLAARRTARAGLEPSGSRSRSARRRRRSRTRRSPCCRVRPHRAVCRPDSTARSSSPWVAVPTAHTPSRPFTAMHGFSR